MLYSCWGTLWELFVFDENKMHLCPPPEFWDLPDGISSQSLDLILQFAAPWPWILWQVSFTLECPISPPLCVQVFHDIAYKAKDRQDLLAGIDEFLDEVIVLPPGEWDPAIRIEPPKSLPSSDKRSVSSNLSVLHDSDLMIEEKAACH